MERRPDVDDRRTTWAVLTPTGRSKLEQAAPSHVETVRRLMLDPLTRAQVRQLGAINGRIRNAIQPAGTSIFGPHVG